MHILDNEFDNPIAELTLYLTLSEEQELRDSLTAILRDNPKGHTRVCDAAYQEEITSAPTISLTSMTSTSARDGCC